MAKEFNDIAKQFGEFRKELRAELRSLEETVQFYSDTCDHVVEIQKDVNESKLDDKDLVEGNWELEQENQKLRERVDELEQHHRLNNLEIKGLPANCGEVGAVKKNGRKLGVEISDCDIDICHKVDTPN